MILGQLKYRHKNIPEDYDVYKLRKLACEYIRKNCDVYMPFLFDEATMKLQNIEEYIKEMEIGTKRGCEVEQLALTNTFNYPISVLLGCQIIHRLSEK